MKRAFNILFELLGVVARMWWLERSFHKGKYATRVEELRKRGGELVKEFQSVSDELDKEHQENVDRYHKVKAEIDKLNKKGK